MTWVTRFLYSTKIQNIFKNLNWFVATLFLTLHNNFIEICTKKLKVSYVTCIATLFLTLRNNFIEISTKKLKGKLFNKLPSS